MKIFTLVFIIFIALNICIQNMYQDKITIPVETYNMMLEDIAELIELKCEGKDNGN